MTSKQNQDLNTSNRTGTWTLAGVQFFRQCVVPIQNVAVLRATVSHLSELMANVARLTASGCFSALPLQHFSAVSVGTLELTAST